MAFSGNYVSSSFKLGLAQARHDFTASTGHLFKMALYTNTATLTAASSVYTATGEVVTGGGYTRPGLAMTVAASMPTLSGSTVLIDFEDALWAASTITARGAMIYNTSAANASVVILDFGVNKISTVGDFSVVFPPANTARAIIRIT